MFFSPYGDELGESEYGVEMIEHIPSGNTYCFCRVLIIPPIG